MLEFEEADLYEAIQEAEPMLEDFYKELLPEHNLPFDPNYQAYLAAAKSGSMFCCTCKKDGKLIGFVVFHLSPYLYSCRCRMAVQDLLYITKSERKGFVGIKLLKAAEQMLRSKGVDIINIVCKVHHDQTKLFERLGYKLVEKHFTKMV